MIPVQISVNGLCAGFDTSKNRIPAFLFFFPKRKIYVSAIHIFSLQPGYKGGIPQRTGTADAAIKTSAFHTCIQGKKSCHGISGYDFSFVSVRSDMFLIDQRCKQLICLSCKSFSFCKYRIRRPWGKIRIPVQIRKQKNRTVRPHRNIVTSSHYQQYGVSIYVSQIHDLSLLQISECIFRIHSQEQSDQIQKKKNNTYRYEAGCYNHYRYRVHKVFQHVFTVRNNFR